MLSNLPLQVMVYFNGWYDVFYTLVMLALHIWKGQALPWPYNPEAPWNQRLATLYWLEIFYVLLLGAVEYSRILLASRGNKTERPVPLIFSLLLAFGSMLLFFYFLYWQVYITRLDQILSIAGLSFVVLELLMSLLVLMTLSACQPCRCPRARGAFGLLASPALSDVSAPPRGNVPMCFAVKAPPPKS